MSTRDGRLSWVTLTLLTILPISCPMVMIETRNRLIYLGDAEDCQQCVDDQMDALGGTLEKGLEAKDPPPAPPTRP